MIFELIFELTFRTLRNETLLGWEHEAWSLGGGTNVGFKQEFVGTCFINWTTGTRYGSGKVFKAFPLSEGSNLKCRRMTRFACASQRRFEGTQSFGIYFSLLLSLSWYSTSINLFFIPCSCSLTQFLGLCGAALQIALQIQPHLGVGF